MANASYYIICGFIFYSSFYTILIMKRDNLQYYIKNKLPFTYKLKNSSARFVVSIKNVYKGKTPKANELINVKNLNKFDSIGGWMDQNDNYYLDLNIHLDSKDDAIKIGNLYDQLAVYDLKENKVINLNN